MQPWARFPRGSFGTQAPASSFPLDRHRHPRMEERAAAQVPHPQFITHVSQKRHNGPLSTVFLTTEFERCPSVVGSVPDLENWGAVKQGISITSATYAHSALGQWNLIPRTLQELTPA
jgi:hypothetical protein